ncbi:MAG: FtsX-like permease family protein [Clostridia bacterium]|nr:FtsX-like permease family protein [Clostridia bacterium]
MNIIIKFLLKNIKEKKLRTALILFSITISAALFFASSATTDSMVKMYTDQIKKFYGESEIIIEAKDTAPSRYFNPTLPQEYKSHLQYSVGLFSGTGIYKYKRSGAKDENVSINLRGIDWKDQQIISKVTLASEFEVDPFQGKKIVISKKTADKYGLEIGKTLELMIEGTKYKFLISGIAQMTGPFTDDGRSHFAIVPMEILSSIYDQKGNVSTIYIKTLNSVEKQWIIKGLTASMKKQHVRETISQSDLQEQTGGVTVALSMALVLVLFMSVFIIYTSFKVITTERLPVIGTFRSIGATRKVTDFVLLGESVAYGVIGGLLGSGLGIGILYLIAKATTPTWDPGYKTSVQFTSAQLITSFLMAVILSLLSSLIPILKVSRIPVKEIVLNKIEKNQKGSKIWKPILGIIFLLAAFFVPPVAKGDPGILMDTVCTLLSIAAVILLLPYLVRGFVAVFERLYIYIFGNEGVLAVKNLRNNKNLLNNVSLLAIGISSLLMINTVTRSSVTEIINYFDTCMKYQMFFWVPEMDKSYEPILKAVDGIKGAKGFYSANGIEVKGTDKKIDSLESANKDFYMDYIDITLDGSKEATLKKLEQLENERSIIITGVVRNKLGVKEGDSITLKMPAGDRTYKIIAIWDSMMMGGNYAAIAEKYLKQDMQSKYYSYFAIKSDKNPEELLLFLKDKFARNLANGQTMKEIKDMVVESNSQIFNVMNAFSVITILIGVFGVLNNLIISFIERKRSLAVFRSVGMNKKQIVKMIFIESMTGGLIGGIVGVAAGLIMINIMKHMLTQVIATIPMNYSITMLTISATIGVIIMVTASISPAMKSSKLNIIESIKYE